MSLFARRATEAAAADTPPQNPLAEVPGLPEQLHDPLMVLKLLWKAPVAIMMTDAQGNILYGNSSAIKDQNREDIGQIVDDFKAAISSVTSFPHRVSGMSGTRWTESSIDVLKGKDKQVVGYICSYTDRTAERDALQKASELAERLGDTISVSESIQSVAASTDQMVASIGEIAQGSARAAETARSAVDAARRTGQTVGKLDESSSQIGKIVKVIRSIAEQTNLLALNATIEAARAGEAGKGFAIVAGEVKELARATSAATEEISRMVEAIQGDAGEAISAIAEISAVVEEIDEIQQTIASAVEEQSATTSEIGARVTSAARTAEDIAVFVAARA